jgi:hypothetical protein
MNPLVLAALTLPPAIAGAVRLAQALHARSARWSRAIIRWGALTMVAGFVAHAANMISLFPAVGHAAPEEKADLLAAGLPRGSLALSTGFWMGATLLVLGGVTRSLFKAKPETPPA